MVYLLAYGYQQFWVLPFTLNLLKMDANNIVLWFSIVVSILVVVWAVMVIRAYDQIDKND